MTPHGGSAADFDVAVVGGGPVGLAAANLLAARGHSVVLFERNATTSDEAKAISLDDESLRALQPCGLADAVLRIVVPGTGTRYYDRHGRPLFHASTPTPYRLGYPFKNPFSQPELEQVLLRALLSRPTADVRFRTAVSGLTQSATGVEVHTEPVGPESAEPESAGRPATHRVHWVLGCDGGRSAVRRLLGIDMAGRSHDQAWLVVDTTGDPHDEQYGMHHGDPARPHVIVAGRDGRCRYEFLLRPGECAPGAPPPIELVRRLVAPYRALDEHDIERAVTYTFHALVADRWRDGRCFLVGDAAHMMPPFAGQGLNSGIRDVANLCWKLSDVLSGRLGQHALDSYEAERRPHAEATVTLSERLGSIVMTRSRPRAAARDLIVRSMLRTRRGRRYLEQMRYRPSARITRGLIRPTAGEGAGLIGVALGQPRVYDLTTGSVLLLDDALGGGWSLVGVDLPPVGWRALRDSDAVERLAARVVDVSLDGHLRRAGDGRRVISDVDGALRTTFESLRGRWALLRPDRVVAATGTAGGLADLATGTAGWSASVAPDASPSAGPPRPAGLLETG